LNDKTFYARKLANPLGVVGIISASNFPVLVWAWNALPSFLFGGAQPFGNPQKKPTYSACSSIANLKASLPRIW